MQAESAKTWLLWILAPLAAVIALDQWTKAAALGLTVPVDLGAVRLVLWRNPGFMLGAMASLSKLYTVVVPSTIGAFLLFLFGVLQYFLPIESRWLRAGSAVFCGGVLSNIADRALHGSVVDFIYVATPYFHTGVFNVADALQWVGVVVFVASYVANGRLLYPPEQRRGRKWIDPRFQAKYCMILIAAGAGFAVVAGTLSYTFLRFTIAEISGLGPVQTQSFVRSYLLVYAAAAASFFVALFVIGLHLSHRIAGPIRGFENFLSDFLAGNLRQLKLREKDEFKRLETLADRFYQQFHERLGIEPNALEAGMPAPAFEAVTYDQKTVTAASLKGRKAWIIFYRYATCPLCAEHLRSIQAVIERAQRAGVQVLAVYESQPEEFGRTECGATAALLESMRIPLISDPERRLYRAFRTRRNRWAVAFPGTLITLFKARRSGFKQGKIEGDLGQLPAHFLIDADGVIAKAFYGESFVDHIDLVEVDEFVGSSPRSAHLTADK
jgi:lipoprotein signal peptidase/peroxiredoxin